MIKDSLKTIALSLAILSLIGIARAWTEPSSNPPAGNISAPINTSGADQTKTGALEVNGLWNRGTTTLDGNVNYGGQLSKLDAADNFTATTRAADFNLGYSDRRGSPGRALVDLGSQLVINYGPDWSGGLATHGNLLVSGNVGIGTESPGSSKLRICDGGSCYYFVKELVNGIGGDEYGSSSAWDCRGSDTCDGDYVATFTCGIKDVRSCGDCRVESSTRYYRSVTCRKEYTLVPKQTGEW